MPYLLDEPAWKALQNYYDSNGSKINILQLFKQDPARFDKFKLVFSRRLLTSI